MTDSSTSRTPVVDVVPASVEPPRQRSRSPYLSGAETGALILVLAAGVLRGWATLSGYFYWDDYLLAGRAARVGLSPDLLLFDHDGHFMPGAMLLTWLVTKIAPMSFLLPALLMILAQLAAGAAFYFLLREIFGRRPLALVPLCLFLFTPMTLPSSIWWSAAVNLLPMQIAGSLLGLAVVRNARTPSRRHVVAATAAYVLGLLFFEKSVLLLIVAGGLAVLIADPTRPGTVRRAWRGQRAVAVSLTLVTAAYLAVYKTYLSSTHLHMPADPSVLTETYHRGLSDTVGPALLGGPLTWTPTGWGSAISTPPTWFVWTSLLALASLVGLTAYLRPRATAAWLLAAGYVAVDLTLFAVTRLVGPAGAVVIQSTRYTADAALVIGLALGFALMAPQGAEEVSRQPEVHDWVRGHRQAVSAGTAVACGLALVASTLSTARFVDIWHANASRAFIVNAKQSLARTDPSVPLLDQAVPEFVLYGLAYPYHLDSWVFAPLKDRPPFAARTTTLKVLDAHGHLVRGVVEGRAASHGPVRGCGWKVSTGPAVIPLDGPFYDWEWTLRVGYFSTSGGTGTVQAGDGLQHPVTFRPGLNALVLTVVGGGQDVVVRVDDAHRPVCVSDVQVGQALPWP